MIAVVTIHTGITMVEQSTLELLSDSFVTLAEENVDLVEWSVGVNQSEATLDVDLALRCTQTNGCTERALDLFHVAVAASGVDHEFEHLTCQLTSALVASSS